ncbi:MAG: hypothetical protein JSV03_06400, partial [Planctomycetota bacterium]
ACWGQGRSGFSILTDQLFGNPEWKSNEITEAWFQIWHLLTRGTVAKDGISWFCTSYKNRPYQVFCPLDGVVVFDHHVGFKHLDGVEVIFLTGLGVTPETIRAVERCVLNGATCVGLPHLLPRRVITQCGSRGILSDGRGLWIVTDDFLADRVRRHVRHVIPKQDVIRYQFGKYVVNIKPVDSDMNRLTVNVSVSDNTTSKSAP